VLVLAAAAINFGMVSVLADTNGEPWQQWLLLLLTGIGYALGLLQFALGERRKIWGTTSLRYWRLAAWFFGVLLFLGVALQVVQFHLRHAGLLR
jgi:hypothetical protein